MLDIKVYTFLTVCEEMNFTKAAAKLHISQPAVTQHIHSLEEYYQIPLFQFEGKRFFLTEYGKLIRDTFLSLKNNEFYLKEQLDTLKKGSPVINMGATLTVGEFLIANPLSRYLKAQPDADITLSVTNTQELLAKLDSGAIDFAVLEGDYPKSAYSHQTLYNTDFIPVCSASHQFSGEVCGIRDLLKERLIIREPGSGTRKILETELDKSSLSISEFRNVITIGNMNAILDIVAEGCGITFLYKNAVEEKIQKNILRQIPLCDFHIKHEISAVWKKDNLQSARITGQICRLFSHLR